MYIAVRELRGGVCWCRGANERLAWALRKWHFILNREKRRYLSNYSRNNCIFKFFISILKNLVLHKKLKSIFKIKDNLKCKMLSTQGVWGMVSTHVCGTWVYGALNAGWAWGCWRAPITGLLCHGLCCSIWAKRRFESMHWWVGSLETNPCQRT